MIDPTERESRRARTAGSASRDRTLLFGAKALRALGYGSLSAFLFLYLTALGVPPGESLFVTALTLVGTAVWSLVVLPLVVRRAGRRRAVQLFAGLFALSAGLFFVATGPVTILASVLLGGVAASSADNGPLASLDAAILPQLARGRSRTAPFAQYNVLANFSAAGGALLVAVPGIFAPIPGVSSLGLGPRPWILLAYLVFALGSYAAVRGLSSAIEVGGPPAEEARPLPPRARRTVRDLTALFGLDAFAGGFTINPIIAAYFVLAWGATAAMVGGVLFAVGAVSALSLFAAQYLADRIGLLPTMVFTHLPSNVLLIAVPFMPSFGWAFGVLLARYGLSQMDVPTRQAYAMHVVAPVDRARASAVLSGTRSVAQSAGPFPGAALLGAGWLGAPLVLAGSLKVVYDALLWRRFRREPLVEGTDSPDRPTTVPRSKDP